MLRLVSTVRGRSWFLAQTDVGYLKSVPGLSEAARSMASTGHARA